MEITRGVRLLLCAMPQPGWGGTDLAGYTESIGMRPDVDGSEEECAQALARLTNAGLAQSLGGEPERWELTAAGQTALETVAESTRRSIGEVLLDLQPSVALTGAEG
jgi:hypothetical protein